VIFFRDKSSVTGRYPIHEIFRHLESGDGKGFVEHVADYVDWTVEGTHLGTHPLAGPYQIQDDFLARTFERTGKGSAEGCAIARSECAAKR